MDFKQITSESIKDCNNYTSIIKKFNYKYNGRLIAKLKSYISENEIDISHFYTTKYQLITKICPVCSKEFKTKNDEKESLTCSYSCSNTHFRSGKNHGNYKDGSSHYRHKVSITKCERCGYNKHPSILHVHHKDRNRLNNNEDNLEVLCPNCHHEEHFNMKDGMFYNLKE